MIILRRRKYSINDIHIILKRQENKSDILQQHLELLQCIICYCSNVRLQGYDLWNLIYEFWEKQKHKNYKQNYLLSCDLPDSNVCLEESRDFLPLASVYLSSFESWDDFCRRSISSAYRRHKASLSFLWTLLYLGSGFKRRLAVDHELSTVFPSSVSRDAASEVNTSARRALKSWTQRWPITRVTNVSSTFLNQKYTSTQTEPHSHSSGTLSHI